MNSNVRRNTGQNPIVYAKNSSSNDDMFYILSMVSVFLFFTCFLPGAGMLYNQSKLPENEQSGAKKTLGTLLALVGIAIPLVYIVNLIPWSVLFLYTTGGFSAIGDFFSGLFK